MKWNYFWHWNYFCMLNWIVWNRTVLIFNCVWTKIILNWIVWNFYQKDLIWYLMTRKGLIRRKIKQLTNLKQYQFRMKQPRSKMPKIYFRTILPLILSKVLLFCKLHPPPIFSFSNSLNKCIQLVIVFFISMLKSTNQAIF